MNATRLGSKNPSVAMLTKTHSNTVGFLYQGLAADRLLDITDRIIFHRFGLAIMHRPKLAKARPTNQ
jgi:hypothetical protein